VGCHMWLRRFSSSSPRSSPVRHKANHGFLEVVLTRDEVCAICLKVLNVEDDAASVEAATAMLRAMPCSHIFHQSSIFEWLSYNRSCPLCRYQFCSPKDVNDVE
jgi:hypothetical protein